MKAPDSMGIPLVTDCCTALYIEGSEFQQDGQWWGRCCYCREMAQLVKEVYE